MNSIYENGIKYIEMGLNTLPAKNKRPTIDSWKPYQDQKITKDIFHKLYKNQDSIGFVCGKISGGLEVLDFDNKLNNIVDVFNNWRSIPDVKSILDKYQFPIENTAGGGFHLYYKCEIIGSNQKLASVKDSDGKPKAFIETRGEGGFIVVSPSKGYQLISGSLENIPIITPEERETLLSYCWTFNLVYNENKFDKSPKNGSKIGEIFNNSENAREIIESLLDDSGYKLIYSNNNGSYYRRPGKKEGSISVCYNGKTLYCFSSSCDHFEIDKAYSNFTIYAILKHDGDFKKAAADLSGNNSATESEINEGPKPFLKIKYFDNNVSYKIDYAEMEDFLANEGFYRLKITNEYTIVKVVDKVIYPVMMDEILDHIKSMFSGKELSYITEIVPNILSKMKISFLPVLNYTPIRDTKEKTYFFFTDSVVEITAATINILSYSELQGYVFAEEIIQSKILIDHTKNESDFKRFIMRAINKDKNPERYDSLISAIGYLLHRYKNPSVAKAIIICDEGDSDNDSTESNGRTGKSLIYKAVDKMRKVFQFSARNTELKGNHLWQSINENTDIICFNDAEDDFTKNFSKLFNIITDGIIVEKKFKDQEFLSFEKTPKILVTTNFVVPQNDESSLDRMHEIEFTHLFNSRYKPVDEFGKLFFDDWNESEWLDFYYFMFSCIQYYLKHGLVQYQHYNLEERKLSQSVGNAFVEYFYGYVAENKKADGSVKLVYRDFYEAYTQANPKSNLKQESCSKKINNIIKFKKIIHRKGGNGSTTPRYVDIPKI